MIKCIYIITISNQIKYKSILFYTDNDKDII